MMFYDVLEGFCAFRLIVTVNCDMICQVYYYVLILPVIISALSLAQEENISGTSRHTIHDKVIWMLLKVSPVYRIVSYKIDFGC